MALELFDNAKADPVHLSRHDLESLFYILIWAATIMIVSRGLASRARAL